MSKTKKLTRARKSNQLLKEALIEKEREISRLNHKLESNNYRMKDMSGRWEWICDIIKNNTSKQSLLRSAAGIGEDTYHNTNMDYLNFGRFNPTPDFSLGSGLGLEHNDSTCDIIRLDRLLTQVRGDNYGMMVKAYYRDNSWYYYLDQTALNCLPKGMLVKMLSECFAEQIN